MRNWRIWGAFRARAWVGKTARELRAVHQTIGQRVAEAEVRHLGETGYLSVSEAHRDIVGKLHWLHTTSSLPFTFCRAGEKRGDIPRDLQGASSCMTISCRIAG
jgi:hypothetical protein